MNRPPADLRAALRQHALQSLARREHTRAELQRKLSAFARRRSLRAAAEDHEREGGAENDTEADLMPLLDELQARGLLSDERAAETLLAGRGGRLGPLRLQQAMRARGFDAELTQSTLARSREGEFERALAAWQRKFGQPASDARERARQARFLAARGFGATVIARVLKGGAASDDT